LSCGKTLWHKAAKQWLLRNPADPGCDMVRGYMVFHTLRFLQMNHWLPLLLFPLVLSVLILFAVMEHTKLEQIDFGATIHTSFDKLEPIHIAALSVHCSRGALSQQGRHLYLFEHL